MADTRFTVPVARTDVVTFSGRRGATGPATWTQRSTWHWLNARTEKTGSTNIGWVIDLPETTSLAGALAGIRRLTERHECLRTTMAPGKEGVLLQRVVCDGSLPVLVWDLTGEPAHDPLATTLAYELTLARFDPETELPVRYGVVRWDGGYRALVAGSRFALDGSGYDVLRTELAALASDDAYRALDRLDDPWQPLDQADLEASAEGRRLNDAALQYWRETLLGLPVAQPPRVTVRPGRRRHWSGKLISKAAAAALDLAAGRNHMTSAVLLAVTADVMWRHFGLEHSAMKMIVSNRLTRRERNALYSIGQDGLIVLDAATPSFDELVRRAGHAVLQACRFSRYDPDQMTRGLSGLDRRSEVAFAVNSLFNPHNLKPQPTQDGMAAGVAAIDALRLDTTFVDWFDPFHGVDEVYLVSIWRDRAGLNLAMMADTELIGADDHRALLYALEDRLIRAVAPDRDPPASSERSADVAVGGESSHGEHFAVRGQA